MKSIVKVTVDLVLFGVLTACTTINIDQIQLENDIDVVSGDAVVVLGRHHSAEFETEASLIRCLSNRLKSGTNNLVIIPEEEFVDEFYPWFEARTAPLHPAKLRQTLDLPFVAKKIAELNVRFFVWVEGSTERTGSAGSMACSIEADACQGMGKQLVKFFETNKN